MSEKRIMLAHGLGGEMGVPTTVRKSGLPWPWLEKDSELVHSCSVLIMGKASYDLARKWLENDMLLLGVSASSPDYDHVFPSLKDAIYAAEQLRPGEPLTLGGGARLAKPAFQLLEMEGTGQYFETVVHDPYPLATAFVPEFNEAKWSKPQVLATYEAEERTRELRNGNVAHEHVPAYHIQVRHVLSM